MVVVNLSRIREILYRWAGLLTEHQTVPGLLWFNCPRLDQSRAVRCAVDKAQRWEPVVHQAWPGPGRAGRTRAGAGMELWKARRRRETVKQGTKQPNSNEAKQRRELPLYHLSLTVRDYG
ncbi:unnamed protein product [Calypogeia fissa]